MPIIGTPNESPIPDSDVTCDTLGTVTAPITVIEGCPILTRGQAFEFAEGVAATLEFTLRNNDGTPVDLTNCLDDSQLIPGSSVSASAVDVPLRVRFREAVGLNESCPYREAVGTVVAASDGLVHVDVPEEIYERSGVYTVNWGIFSGSRLVYNKQSWICITRSLFGVDVRQDMGPPTIDEIRMAIRDSSMVDNTLLQRMEFDNAELGMAIIRPIKEWNESPPPIPPLYSTHTFPFKEAWLWGIQGYLLQTAAYTYRRNQLAYQAAGVTLDDMNKEASYLQAANYYLQQWRDFMSFKKVSINASRAMGVVGSAYSWSPGNF